MANDAILTAQTGAAEAASVAPTAPTAATVDNATDTLTSKTTVQPQSVQPHSAPVAGNLAAPLQAVPARRVGTVTMGLGLIFSGVLLCVSLFYPAPNILLLSRFAPLLLALLGVEILVCHARAKTVPIKYDVLSIFLCGFIIVCAIFVTCAVAAMLFSGGFYDTMQYQGLWH